MLKRAALAAAALVAFAAPVFAHSAPGAPASLMAGLSHPLLGLDHILAMVAVGLWAAQIGGRSLWAVPAAFVVTMGLGFLLGLGGPTLPFVEPMIAASVVVLGLLVAASARLPIAAGTLVAAAFALFHGHAHAAEVGSAGVLVFGAGFAVATALLHVLGIGVGQALGSGHGLARRAGTLLSRALGLGTAAAGLAIMVG